MQWCIHLQAFNVQATPLHIEGNGQLRTSLEDASFQGPISVAWLAHQLLICKLAPNWQGKTKERSKPLQTGNGRFDKMGTKLQGLSWATPGWVDLCTHYQILSIYRGLKWLQSSMLYRWFINTLLSQDCVLRTTPTLGIADRVYILRTGDGGRGIQLLGSGSRVNCWSHLDYCLQQWSYWKLRCFGNSSAMRLHYFPVSSSLVIFGYYLKCKATSIMCIRLAGTLIE